MSYAQSYPSAGGGGTVQVTAKFFPLAFLLYFFKPKVAIDGREMPATWGTTNFPVAPGRHQVEAWVPYLFYRNMGRNGLTVDVTPGGVVAIKWRAPWLVFLKGPISLVAPTPGAGAPPVGVAPAAAQAMGGYAPTPAPAPGAWHPDPSGRHELRYYDGSAWTANVSDQGVTAVDPLG